MWKGRFLIYVYTIFSLCLIQTWPSFLGNKLRVRGVWWSGVNYCRKLPVCERFSSFIIFSSKKSSIFRSSLFKCADDLMEAWEENECASLITTENFSFLLSSHSCWMFKNLIDGAMSRLWFQNEAATGGRGRGGGVGEGDWQVEPESRIVVLLYFLMEP